MGPINESKPVAILHLSYLDTELVQALSKHWLVVVQFIDDYVLELLQNEFNQ